MTKVILINFDDASPNILPHCAQTSLLQDIGATFTRNAISVPVCSPSRAGTFTGKFAHNNHVLENGGENGSYKAFMEHNQEDQTIATVLAAEGVVTAMMGKYINGYDPDGGGGSGAAHFDALHVPPGWTEWWGIGGNGYQEFNYSATELLGPGPAVEFNTKGDDPDNPVKNLEGNFLTDLLKARSLDFVTRHAADDFLLVLSPFVTHIGLGADPEDPDGHVQYPAAPRDRRKSAGWPDDWADPTNPLTGNLGVGDFTFPDPPGALNFNRRMTHAPAWFPPGELKQAVLDAYERHHAQRIMCAQSVDAMVTDLRALCVSLGIDDDVWFIFTTDNGYHLGEHEIPVGKGTAYPYDAVLPLIIVPPGGMTPVTVGDWVTNIDFAPTICEIFGVEPPDDFDGKSCLGAMGMGDAHAPRQWAFVSYDISTLLWDDAIGTGEPPGWFAVYSDKWLFIDYRPDDPGITPEASRCEIYDLENDPWLLENLSPTLSPESAAALHALIQGFIHLSGEDCYTAQTAPLPDITFTEAPPEDPSQTETFVQGYNVRDFGIIGNSTDWWGWPSLRGDDLMIPTQIGEDFNPAKVYGPRVGTIELWALGLDNLDRLMTLFAPRGDQIEVVQTRGDMPARRLVIQITNASNLTRLGDKNAHLLLDFKATSPFWEDDILVTQTMPVATGGEAQGTAIVFDQFIGAEAPSQGATITLAGRVINPLVQDNIGGFWYDFDGSVGHDGALIVNVPKGTAVVTTEADPTGEDVTDLVQPKFSAPLMTVIPKLSDGSYRFVVTADDYVGDVFLTISDRRKYLRGL